MIRKTNYKIGQIVPSSNVTMETEIPALFRLRETIFPERFTFHSTRMRMKHVNKDELVKMDAASDECALQLSDAQVDVIGYACLVAIMSMGRGYHCVSQERLHQQTILNGYPTPVITSAGALVDSLHIMKAKKIAIVAPYMKQLTELVVDYIENQGLDVVDYVSLEVSDNLAVASLDPRHLLQHYKKLNLRDVDTIVLSACVQMPSLPVVAAVENESGIRTVTAAIATTYNMLKALKLEAKVPNAGELLSGKY